MPAPKPLPASIRTLKTRLKVLGRPTVWGAASILTIALFFLSEYWQHPEQFLELGSDRDSLRVSEESEFVTPLSPLDPLSAVEDVETGSQLESALAPFSTDSGQSSFETLRLSRQPLTPSLRSSAAPSVPIPSSSSEPEVNLRLGLSSLETSTSFPTLSEEELGDTAVVSTTGTQTQSVTSNALQSALDRRATATTVYPQTSGLTSVNSGSLSQSDLPQSGTARTSETAPSAQPGSTYSPQPLPGQPLPYQTFPQPQFAPQISPPPGTTGYRLPATLSSPTDSTDGSFDRPSNSSNIAPLPLLPQQTISPLAPSRSPGNGVGNGVNPQPQFSQPASISAPFSVPRIAPGQAIGGGQINTFSNP